MATFHENFAGFRRVVNSVFLGAAEPAPAEDYKNYLGVFT